MGYSPWGHREVDTTERVRVYARVHTHTHIDTHSLTHQTLSVSISVTELNPDNRDMMACLPQRAQIYRQCATKRNKKSYFLLVDT